MFIIRCQYYGVWKLAEAACILAGFGFREAEKDFGGVANVKPLEVELAFSQAKVMKVWNIHTQSWLERYVFKRTPRSVNKFLVFAASAFFWYGLKRANTRPKKILTLTLAITSSGMTLQDLARKPAAAKAWPQLHSGFRGHTDE
jgi:lysophospholipid acyltransferase